MMPRLLVVSLITLIAPLASAQTPLHLGDDPTGDARLAGATGHLDTWVDITNMYVHTEGTDLVFHLGLRGTTTELGSYCFMAAFQRGSTEYVGLDCFEGVAYQNNNALSGASRPSTSRGTNVPGTAVTFTADAAVIRIPIAGFGGKIGDVIDDIYGLTYTSRALNTADTIPNEKTTASAAESLGSYVLGADFLGLPVEVAVPDEVEEVVSVTYEEVSGAFERSFDNLTRSVQYNWTVMEENQTWVLSWNTTAGSAQAGLLGPGNQTLMQTQFNGTGNSTLTLPAGTFRIRVDAQAATGSFSVAPMQAAAFGNETVMAADNSTADQGEAVKDTPGIAVPALLATIGLVALSRRRTV